MKIGWSSPPTVRPPSPSLSVFRLPSTVELGKTKEKTDSLFLTRTILKSSRHRRVRGSVPTRNLEECVFGWERGMSGIGRFLFNFLVPCERDGEDVCFVWDRDLHTTLFPVWTSLGPNWERTVVRPVCGVPSERITPERSSRGS